MTHGMQKPKVKNYAASDTWHVKTKSKTTYNNYAVRSTWHAKTKSKTNTAIMLCVSHGM
jgi:hypothetical protein